jgi:hypothetical protein
MGFDVASPAKGYPLQVLGNPEETWKPFSLGTVRFEKDNPEPAKEITLKVPNADYRFRGYRLDAKRFPEFSYEFRKLTLKDRFVPSVTSEGIESLDRVVSIAGEAEAGAMFRVAEAAGAPDAEGWYPLGPVSVQVPGVKLETRAGAKGSELLVPVAGPQELHIHYRWNAAVAGKAVPAK